VLLLGSQAISPYNTFDVGISQFFGLFPKTVNYPLVIWFLVSNGIASQALISRLPAL